MLLFFGLGASLHFFYYTSIVFGDFYNVGSDGRALALVKDDWVDFAFGFGSWRSITGG